MLYWFPVIPVQQTGVREKAWRKTYRCVPGLLRSRTTAALYERKQMLLISFFFFIIHQMKMNKDFYSSDHPNAVQ